MGFDYEKYSALLGEFISKGKALKRFRPEDVEAGITPLCKAFNVAKITTVLFESEEFLSSRHGMCRTYYDDGTADEDRAFTYDENTVQNRLCRCSVYPKKGCPEWTETEIHHIREFVDVMFLFTERAYTLKMIEEIPIHDRELGVYSVSFFTAALKSVIEKGAIGNFGIAFFNIRRLSAINESLGRDSANIAMKQFFEGIVRMIKNEECVCRIGGDNFIMLFAKERTDDIKKYLSGTAVTYGKGNEKITMSAVAGYYLIPDNADNPNDIIDCVCMVYQLAKNVYKRPFLFYDEELINSQKRARLIESIFPGAISNEEFKVYYQPKTQLNNYMMAGAEALCRWYRDGKIIPPNEFIPVLEKSKAICTLDFYMLEHVCRDIRRWLDEKREVVKVSINLSRVHLGDGDLLENIISIVDKYNVPHNLIEIELTETTTDVDFGELKQIVNGLHEQNISTSVDDFGMGYSSLNLIRELPWNVLKIDKSFLPRREENNDPSKTKILRHIITMSQDLGIDCIVEGVETAEHVKLLRDCKCFLAQGFYFDKPLPVEEFERRLDDMLS